ncbi:MAG: chlorophyll synthase ChlG [Lautropia sp.]
MDRRLQPEAGVPAPAAVLELLKPITWFPPMWAFACGMVSSGRPVGEHVGTLVAGLVLAGPLLCAASQATNDWFDRHVDAINQPGRPIPSGRVPGRWGLGIAIAWAVIAAAFAATMGPVVFWASVAGIVLGWIYSAPPLRLKRNGWLGNAAVAVSYEGLAWITGAAILLDGALPSTPIVLLAVLYSIGAHGIMTLNDFKAIEGDRQTGIASVPVQLGPQLAAVAAAATMALPQVGVIVLLLGWDRPWHAAAIALLLAAQVAMMRRLVSDPLRWATWYSGLGVGAYVTTMMIAAFAVATRAPA